jgi:hypothetical protein
MAEAPSLLADSVADNGTPNGTGAVVAAFAVAVMPNAVARSAEATESSTNRTDLLLIAILSSKEDFPPPRPIRTFRRR